MTVRKDDQKMTQNNVLLEYKDKQNANKTKIFFLHYFHPSCTALKIKMQIEPNSNFRCHSQNPPNHQNLFIITSKENRYQNQRHRRHVNRYVNPSAFFNVIMSLSQ